MYRKESDYENFGKGYPGYKWEVRLYRGDREIARAFGPNVHGPCIGEFRDMAAVKKARALPDGPVSEDFVLGLLSDYYRDQLKRIE